MVDITPIVNAIIALATALITAFLIPWIKSKVSAEKLSQALKMVSIAVSAAEQLADANGWDGAAKKSYVKKYLMENGYTIDDSIDAAIESAVYEINNQLVS